jgi:hypothetical protein
MKYTELEDYYPAEIKYSKFTVVPDEQPDPAYNTVCRRFSGRLTKARYKAVSRFCRMNTWRRHCSHEWDCCGCLFAQRMSFTYRHNQISIFIHQSRNY